MMEREIIFSSILGIKELVVIEVSESDVSYELSVRSILSDSLCIKCGNKCSRVKSYNNRKVRDLPISGKKVILEIEVRQFECDCGNYFNEPFGFVRPYKKLTIRYEKDLYFRCKGTDLNYISEKESLDWKTVNELFQSYGRAEISGRSDWDRVTHIALDEIALRKGHGNYVVVVLDLLSGVILDLLEKRDKEFLINYFKKKGDVFCQRIEVFCSDMWQAYLSCAKELFTNALIVADRFHFFGKCQQGIEHARKSFRRSFPEEESLKNLKWALLKNEESLNEKDREKLDAVFGREEFHLLRLTWDARNTLRDIFNCPIAKEIAEKLIEEWIQGVVKLKIRYFFKFVKFYKKRKDVILNYFEGRFSTGKLEGTNNKLKLIKRRAFGFLEFESFKLRAMVEFF